MAVRLSFSSLLLALGLFTGPLLFAGPTVFTDLEAARAAAARENKQLLVEFSGRTWCPPCQALLAEVLNTPEFAAFAADRVVAHLDYPVRSERTPEKIAADPGLARLIAIKDAHCVEGFPTVVLLAPDGTEIGRMLGYKPGMGPTAYLAELTGAK